MKLSNFTLETSSIITPRAVLFLTLTACILMSSLTSAQVYRWTDENGKIHYGDEPPRQGNHEDISTEVRPINIDESHREQEKLSKIFAPETEEEKQLARQQKSDRQQKVQEQKKICDSARRRLKIITEERFILVDEEGNQFDISKKEAEQKRLETEAFLRKNC